MLLPLIAICIAVVFLAVGLWMRRARLHAKDEMEQHSITAEALHASLASNPKILLYDVRQPLDLLAYPEIIPGARRISPKDVIENPALIPKEKDSVIYCTCPSDKTSRSILQRALALHFDRIKLLKGGLAAWKALGYPVEPYRELIQL
jgi:rhodanese-related sulfurtransferase